MKTIGQNIVDKFRNGESSNAYDYFGVHKLNKNHGDGYVFRAWLPNADSVFLVGDFNSWCDDTPMTKDSQNGIFEATLASDCFGDGSKYKFLVKSGDFCEYKADPFAHSSEGYPNYASVYRKLPDGGNRSDFAQASAMHIYRVNLENWKRRADGGLVGYTEIAPELASYTKQMGFTHIEFTSFAEHCNGKTVSFFAPSSAQGSPEDFVYLIKYLHSCGVGVILNLDFDEFSDCESGLYLFDGSSLYHTENSRSFDLEKGEICSFLLSNAVFWLEKYNADGLRIKIDQSNGCASDFLKTLAETVSRLYPKRFIICENAEKIGCLPNLLSYDTQTTERVADCFINERCADLCEIGEASGILSQSFGNMSIISAMPGDYDKKFRLAKMLYAFTAILSDRKNLQMGDEYAPFRSANAENALEWFMTDFEAHSGFRQFIRELNFVFLENDGIFGERQSACFCNGVLKCRKGRLLAIFNFSPNAVKCPNDTGLAVLSTDERADGEIHEFSMSLFINDSASD